MDKVDDIMDPGLAMAAERTVLAWMRTGLSLMGFGFVVARFGLFLREIAGGAAAASAAGATAASQAMAVLSHGVAGSTGAFSRWMGVTLVLLGVVVEAFTAVQHAAMLSDRRERVDRRRRISGWVAVWITGLVAAVGVVMGWYLVVVK